MPCFALHRLRTASELFRCRVLDQSNLSSIHTILILSQLRWAGHVARMPDHRVPRNFYGELQQAKRSNGGQKERFKDTLKTTLNAFNINPDTWEQTAMDRAEWRYCIYKDASLGEERRTTAAQQKRQARKAQASKQEHASDSPCPSCHRTFRARFALISPLHIHNLSQSPPPPSQPQDD